MASTSHGAPLRQRKHPAVQSPPRSVPNDDEDEHLSEYHVKNRSYIETLLESEEASMAAVAILTALAFALRFYKINWPDQVVFDEVHFGKFASYYILRQYYFDVHPPLAKMLFGLAGWFVGYDGHFMFENIGDSYLENHVPYVGLRALPAILGSLTVPITYATMKECGYSTIVAVFSASIILLDNAHVAQSRLILLDATFIFFMALTIYSYIRFRKLRYLEFSAEWWSWLLATGTFMACTWASKVNGVLTVVAIGIAVLVDLWDLLDYRKSSMEYFWKHFMARAVGLIALPIVLYLLFFYIHLSILTNSGPGDTFMSPAFQETLIGNELLLNSHEIRYYDTISLKHKDTRVFLHSHPDRYPLKYDDGRISSQGQQVTGYGHDDSNNYWQIVPTKALPETGRGRIVRHDDVVQLLHVNTQTYLLTHDVASSLMPTNEEFTTWPKDDVVARYNDTLFQLRLVDGEEGTSWKSKSGHFRLIHVPTKVAMWTHSKQLPEWAFSQQEVNGNKNVNDKTAIWFVDNIVADETGEDIKHRVGDLPAKPPKRRSFFKKFAELQLLMLQHNAGLTASHPYASTPINWPFLLSGISFWTDQTDQKQIYLMGNIVGWWTCVVSLSIYIGIIGGDLLMRRRGENPIQEPVRNRLWNSTGFFVVFWAVHYFPFYLMGRQLFIHHYLPSHLASALVAGSILSFVLSETVNYPTSVPGPLLKHPKPATKADLGVKGPIIVGVFIILMLILFIYVAPLTYGTPGLTGEQVNARRLLSGWTLHFAAKPSGE